MDRSNVITLINSTYEQDDNGIWQEHLTEREVFCQVQSVSRNEFFEGGRLGMRPEYKFTMFAYDYEEEPLVRYNGKSYSVYRTYYGRNDELELYVQREGGTNGKVENG